MLRPRQNCVLCVRLVNNRLLFSWMQKNKFLHLKLFCLQQLRLKDVPVGNWDNQTERKQGFWPLLSSDPSTVTGLSPREALMGRCSLDLYSTWNCSHTHQSSIVWKHLLFTFLQEKSRLGRKTKIIINDFEMEITATLTQSNVFSHLGFMNHSDSL